MLAGVRGLLIAQAVGGLLALVALTFLLVLEVVFGAFMIAALLLIAWIALVLAIVLALVGQSRLKRRGDRWWSSVVALEMLILIVGLVLLAYLEVPASSGEPPPPTRNVVLVLILPILAVINLALLLGSRGGAERST